jgi:NADP-dependent 3-hydroxy acid dehydrogenase YdfG
VYIVFGASGGIGSALCKRLVAQDGAKVVLAGRDLSKLEQLQQSLGGGVPMVADPLDSKQVS